MGVDRNVHPGEAAPHGPVLVLGLLGVQGRRPQVRFVASAGFFRDRLGVADALIRRNIHTVVISSEHGVYVPTREDMIFGPSVGPE